MRSSGRAQAVRQLDGACHARAEADAVVGAVHVVVHRLRYADHVDPFVVEAPAVTERIVSTDRNEHVDADVLEIRQHILCDVVDRLVVATEVLRHALARQVTRSGARRMKEGAARAPGAIDDGFGEDLDVLAVVGFRVADVVDEPRPTAPDADDAVSLAEGANGDRADRRIETGHIAAAGENGDRALFGRHVPFPRLLRRSGNERGRTRIKNNSRGRTRNDFGTADTKIYPCLSAAVGF